MTSEESDLEDTLGVHIEQKKDGSIQLTQPHHNDQILKDLRLIDNDNVSTKPKPVSSSKLLSKHSKSEDFDKSVDYRSVMGKLNYLEKREICVSTQEGAWKCNTIDTNVSESNKESRYLTKFRN